MKFMQNLAVALETTRGEFSFFGLIFREEDGQTIFPIIDASGSPTGEAAFYLGRPGARPSVQEDWVEFKFTLPKG